MADNCIQIVTLSDSSNDSKKYEKIDATSDMICVVEIDKKHISAKTPGLKPRYKQSYREAWESVRDFKGWLTSVPGNTTKAYCKLCKKELHCHRLSLLKHKVTFKHHKKEEEQRLIKIREKKNEKNSKLKNIKSDEVPNSDENVQDNKTEEFKIEEYENSDVDVSRKVTKALKPEPLDSNRSCQETEGESPDKNGSLSTHIVDISRGTPAALVHVVLYKLIDGRWTLIHEGLTGTDGSFIYLLANQNEMSIGRYKLHFDVDKYFERQNQETIFPFIEVAFDVKNILSNYHIPILLSPYGYSTYRGC